MVERLLYKLFISLLKLGGNAGIAGFWCQGHFRLDVLINVLFLGHAAF
jgi:hypothetical protein